MKRIAWVAAGLALASGMAVGEAAAQDLKEFSGVASFYGMH